MLRAVRPEVCPNPGFLRQLQEFEEESHPVRRICKERRRVREKQQQGQAAVLRAGGAAGHRVAEERRRHLAAQRWKEQSNRTFLFFQKALSIYVSGLFLSFFLSHSISFFNVSFFKNLFFFKIVSDINRPLLGTSDIQ